MRQGFTRSERFLSLFTYLRPGEGTPALRLCLQSFSIMFAYYLLRVIREPMILAEGSAELRAYSTAVQAVLLMFIVPLMAHLYRRLVSRSDKHHLLHRILWFFIFNLLGFVVAYRLGWSIGILFYIWLGIFSVMVLALFWGFSADLFNIKSGQRLFPLIAAASALGALLGAGSAGRLDALLGHDGVMLCAAALLWIPVLIGSSVQPLIPSGSRGPANGAPDSTAKNDLLQGFTLVLRSRYLMLIAGFVILMNLINTNGSYILARFVTSSLSGDRAIADFYSTYLLFTTLISFLIQLLLVSRIFKYIGVAGALYILPLLMVLSYGLIALLPGLAVARVAMIAENSVSYSLQSTIRHTLFLPVSRVQKYVGKHTIDTFFFRVGDVLSGLLIYVASGWLAVGVLGFVHINIGLAIGLLVLSGAIGRRYRSASRATIRNLPPVVAVPLDDVDIPAGETRRLQLAEDTFIDPDVGDALKYEAHASDAVGLPAWVKFDPLNRSFLFSPPARTRGSLTIRVVARDFEGLSAEAQFTVHYGA